MYDLLKAGNTVNFNTKASVLPTQYNGVIVMGIVTAQVARTFADVQSLHLQVKPYIDGLPNLYTDYSYVIVEHVNGKTEVVGLPWILESSIQLSEKRTYKLIVDDVEPDQVELIRQALTRRGVKIRSFTVE